MGYFRLTPINLYLYNMKKVLYIFLTLSIISVGCSDDDDTVQPTTNLDSNLFGIWVSNEGPTTPWTYTFLSDGTYTDVYGSPPQDTYSGTWLEQNQSLYLSKWGPGNIPYNIQGDSLILDVSIINSTPGETYLFIQQ